LTSTSNAGLLLDPGEILGASGGVNHQPEVRLVKEVHDQVVDDATALVQHARVQRLAGDLQLVDAVGQQVAQKFAGARAMQIDHRHVRDVEHAGVAPHGVMFLDLRAVIDRHVPAAEVDHARAERAMGGVEYGLVGHCGDACRKVAHYRRRVGAIQATACHGLCWLHSYAGFSRTPDPPIER
jgi:hypothetical protein